MGNFARTQKVFHKQEIDVERRLGTVTEVDMHKIIPDKSKSIRRGGLAPIGEYKSNWIFNQMEAIGDKYGFDLDTPISEIPEEAISTILYGSDENYTIQKEYLGITSTYTLNFEGVFNFISNQFNESNWYSLSTRNRHFRDLR